MDLSTDWVLINSIVPIIEQYCWKRKV